MQANRRKLIVVGAFIALLALFVFILLMMLRREPAASPDYKGSISTQAPYVA